MAYTLKKNLTKWPELPCYLDELDLICCRVERCVLRPEREYGDRQTGSIIAHYFLVSHVRERREFVHRDEIADLLGVQPQTATTILLKLSCTGGIPLYVVRGKGWVLDTMMMSLG